MSGSESTTPYDGSIMNDRILDEGEHGEHLMETSPERIGKRTILRKAISIF